MVEREMPEVEVFTAADGEQGLRVVPQVVDVLAENERLRACLSWVSGACADELPHAEIAAAISRALRGQPK